MIKIILLFFLFSTVVTWSQTGAINIDFETGDYTGWQLRKGTNVNSVQTLSSVVTVTNGAVNTAANNCTITTQQSLMTGTANIDPFCSQTLNSPLGGNFVARLNRSCGSQEGSLLEQNFAVTSANLKLIIAYLVVLESPSIHGITDQPYFSYQVLDGSGSVIPGSEYNTLYPFGTPPPDFNTSGSFIYKPWTTDTIDLTAYIGQNVTVRFAAAGCPQAGHSGYAYVDTKTINYVSSPNVWPGDTDYDLNCHLSDLLPIGLSYGATGNMRSSVSNLWIAQPSNDWGQISTYGELKHADCNGDGAINLDDTLAIVTNYNQTHVFKTAEFSNQNAIYNTSTTSRNILLSVTNNTVYSNQLLNVTIEIPNSTLPASDKLYGISFRVQIPSPYIDQLNSSNYVGSFLGVNGNNMITLSKANVASGYIDYALVRRDHQNSVTAGNLFSFELAVTNFTTDGTGQISVSDIKAISYEGDEFAFGSNVLDLYFTSMVTGISNNSKEFINIYPNPASESLIVYLPNSETFDYEITDLLGQSLLKQHNSKSQQIDVHQLKAGTYLFKAYLSDGIIIKKFIKE